MINEILSAVLKHTEFLSAIGGALGGTIGGGIIAYLVQRQALQETRAQREEDRRRTQQLLGNSLIVKMIAIHSTFYTFSQYLNECFAKEQASQSSREPWQFVLPLANLPNPILFSYDELSMLLALKEDDVFNSVFSMDRMHNGILETISTFHNQRAELVSQLPIDNVHGSAVGSFLDPDLVMQLKPRMVSVNNLADELRYISNQRLVESRDVLCALHTLLREKLDLSYKLQFPTEIEST